MCRNEPGQSVLEREAVLAHKETLGGNLFALTLETVDQTPCFEPGQFVMLRTSPALDPLLGRPFAVCGRHSHRLELLIAVTGRGTRLLAQLPPGERLSLRGPLGKGFPVLPGKNIHCLAGTTGIAPFLLARPLEPKIKIHLGLPGIEWKALAKWASGKIPGLQLYSEDGNIGTRGNPLLCIDHLDPESDVIWACGPTGMLKAVSIECDKRGIQAWVRLKTRMACGIGGCHGCVVRTTGGLRTTCTDGPVFQSREVCWNGF